MRELDAWNRAHGLEDAVRTVHLGDPVADIAGFANEEKASLVVCGSRHLGGVARVFGHSVASELAAVADVPIAVVSG
jgi:nucleotide-binding universal stress UspA family protein